MTGAVLLILFSAEVLTTLLMGSLFGLHFFLGMVLIGPVGLKIGSTVWRFCRYYLGSEPYVRRRPPPTLQRVLGPVLILASAGVLSTGVLLAFTGPTGRWGRLHQLLFYLWLIIVIIHVVHYLPRLPGLLARHPAERALQAAAGSRARVLLLTGSIRRPGPGTTHLPPACEMGRLGREHSLTGSKTRRAATAMRAGRLEGVIVARRGC
jgi:hypothetical protein